jgi:hypothetical protein
VSISQLQVTVRDQRGFGAAVTGETSRQSAHTHDNQHILTTVSTYSRQSPHTHDSHHILTTITTYSRQSAHTHDSQHILTTVTTYSRQSPHTHDSHHILTTVSTYSRQSAHTHEIGCRSRTLCSVTTQMTVGVVSSRTDFPPATRCSLFTCLISAML